MPYKRNGKWLGQVRLTSRTIRKTFQTKQQAIEWEVNQKQQLKKSTKKETLTVCLIDWATAYLSYSESKFVFGTWYEKKTVFKKFFKKVPPDLKVQMLTYGHVLSYLQEQNKTRSGYSANKDRKNLIAAWNWGIKYMGLPILNPCMVDRFPEIREKRYVPPENDFWKVYDSAESEQDRTMLLAYLHLAARRNEIFQLRWEDVDFAQSRLRLYTRKRKEGSLEYDWLPMTDDLYNALLDHRQNSINEWVFPDPRTSQPYYQRNKWMPVLCAAANIKRFGLHGIRHLTASILAKADISLVDIQAVLRHKNLTTTQRYIRRLSALRPVLRVLPTRTISHQQEPPAQKKDLSYIA